jgi:hypothetical protein
MALRVSIFGSMVYGASILARLYVNLEVTGQSIHM